MGKVDAAIKRLGDALGELGAIAWFCDASADGKMALIPSDRRHLYAPSGRMEALTETGCVRLLSRSYCATTQSTRPAIRMTQMGRQVLVRARARRLLVNVDQGESP